MSSKATRDSAVKQFRTITNATQADATRLMKQANYHVQQAVDLFFKDGAAQKGAGGASGSGGSSAAVRKESEKKLGEIFDRHSDEDDAAHDITIEGTMSYCEELSISLEDVVLLPLSFYLQSPTMGRFTRDKFIAGWRTLADGTKACDTISGQQKALKGLKEELLRDGEVKGELGANGSAGLFKRTYDYTYAFAKPEGQKSLPLETALACWDLLIPSCPSFTTQGGNFTQRHLDLWKSYLNATTNGRAVSKDTWSLFLEFVKEVSDAGAGDGDGVAEGEKLFEGHDFDGAWPSIIDGFVTWAREGKGEEGMDES